MTNRHRKGAKSQMQVTNFLKLDVAYVTKKFNITHFLNLIQPKDHHENQCALFLLLDFSRHGGGEIRPYFLVFNTC